MTGATGAGGTAVEGNTRDTQNTSTSRSHVLVGLFGLAMAAAAAAVFARTAAHYHGALDTRLVEAWPAYETALKAARVTYEGHIYPNAVHGFNNDATPERYNKAAADQAWQRTIEWFNKYVRG